MKIQGKSPDLQNAGNKIVRNSSQGSLQDSIEYKEQVASSMSISRPRGDNRYSVEVLNKLENFTEPDSNFINSIHTSQ